MQKAPVQTSETALNEPLPSWHLLVQNTRTMSEIWSKLTIKKPERRQKRRSGLSDVNFKQISLMLLVFPLMNLNKLIPDG